MKMNSSTRSNRRPAGSSRLAIGVASVAAGLALMLTPLGAGGQVVANESNVITVTQTPSGGGDCVDFAAGILNGKVTVQPLSDASVFKLSIHLQVPLCTPVTAKAVVYAMPAAGEWPQTLAEVKTFTLSEAGDTVVSFAKGCDRVQYDVVTGDTPAVINTGFDQSLLFPGNLETAFQHVGNGPNCLAASTTAAPTTTTTTAPATTTTAVVRAATTIATPTTQVKPLVLSETTTPSASNTGLAVTGSTSGPFALMGGGLVFIGLAFMLASRRRTA